ncbi:hypothetical protein SDJN03_12359, partial [Cucurbita argyrosperma subsp. sororia]
MEIGFLHKIRPKEFQEETQEASVVIITNTTGSDPAESTTPSVSYLKVPTFFLKPFRKRFDYCTDNIKEKENSIEIEKKKWLAEVASMFCKIFGGGKLSACGIGGKIDGDDDDFLSESEAGDDYREDREEIFAAESNGESETENIIRSDEKSSSQSRLPTSILDLFRKRNFNFNFIKSRICKVKSGYRNRNLNYEKNLRNNESAMLFANRENHKRLFQIPSKDRKQTKEKKSTAISYHEGDENGQRLWQKRILMGGRCKPLRNTSIRHPHSTLRRNHFLPFLIHPPSSFCDCPEYLR